MKELSIEEKAKRYDKAIEKANSLWHYKSQPCFVDVSEIFPELKESEDESIRKDLIDWVESFVDNVWRGHSKIDIIVWLKKQTDNRDIHLLELKAKAYDDAKERMSYAYNQNRVPIGFMNEIFPNIKLYEKQREQKYVDKIEPKFKVGDWVVYNRNDHSREVIQIYDIRDNRYYFNDNIHFSWSVKECDEKSHLWTIEDAKDGDVLHSPSHHLIWIYKDRGQYHACVNTNYVQHYNFDINGLLDIPKDVFPATKEQSDILFTKIKEAGYAWNEDKKELIKL